MEEKNGQTQKIRYISREDPAYPKRLLPYKGMPKGLYFLGELPDEGPTVAIVGARLCDHYGHVQAAEFGRILAENGVQVISGMALGADSYAQEGALQAGGKTFSVLGCGVDVCYPKSNGAIYRQILSCGGILSEEAPGTPPLSCNFPKRNRIISALADVVLVIEAKEKSGSLITADFALEQGKTVYALPGRVGDALSDGCNYLIAQGAGIAWAPEAILGELHLTAHEEGASEADRRDAALKRNQPKKADEGKMSRTAKLVYHTLSDDPKPLEEILREIPCTIGETASALLELRILGSVCEISKNLYVRS